MAQLFEAKDMEGEEHPMHDDPLHNVKEQIESGIGTIESQPLFEGAGGGEKLPETRVGEALLTDNVQNLDSTKAATAASMNAEESTPEERIVKGGVAETFANEYKENRDEAGDKKEESVSDDGDSVKSGSSGDDSRGSQELPGTKFKKLTGAGIPRGKPHFRISANHGNRGIGDNSFQSGGLGGLRGGSRGGLARTGSGLARTGSGIPQGNNDLRDFSAALTESENQSSEPSLPPSTDEKLRSGDKPCESAMSGGVTETKDTGADKFSAVREATAEKLVTAKDAIVEKAGSLRTGVVATLKDQLLPVKDSKGSTSNMEVDESDFKE